jgi:AcrR family transcriptional regulator
MERTAISKEYMRQVLEAGKKPASVFVFCKQAGISEDEFYRTYSSLDHVRDSILSDLVEEIYQSLMQQETYRAYGFREQVLAFFYSFTEGLLYRRSYLLLEFGQVKEPMQQLKALKQFRGEFMKVADQLIGTGIGNGLLKESKFQKRLQQEALWMNLIGVFSFWLRDRSADFEDTDALIEKSVHLTLNLMEQNTLDKAIDLGRFLFGKAVS